MTRVTCTSDETVKTTQIKLEAWFSVSAFKFISQFWPTRFLWMQENGLDKFSTIVSEVSAFVGNPLYQNEMKVAKKTI